MSVIAKEILKQYITCEDEATRNKFFNMLDSFWHKIEGKIIESYTKDVGGTITGMTVLDKEGVSESVAFPVFPNSKPISFIQDLATELGKLQPKVAGKGLSTNDLTLALLNKLNGLENYQHPEFHQIAEIENLPEALIAKADAPGEGYGFSQENFSLPEKEKLAAYNLNVLQADLDLKADLDPLTGKVAIDQIPQYAITNVVVAAETSLSAFVVNVNSYTFDEGDAIVITDTGVKYTYLYNGNDRSLEASYVDITNSQIDWTQVLNKPTDLETKTGAQSKADAAEQAANAYSNSLNKTQAEIVAAVDAELGSSEWKTQKTTEQIEDIVAALFQAGTQTNVSVVYDDVNGNISITAQAGGATLTNEQVQDIVGSFSASGTGINVFYDDANDSMTFSLSGESFTTAYKNKLDGIAVDATANDTDANLKNRENHTGTQLADTIFQDANNSFVTYDEKATWNGKQSAFTPITQDQYGAHPAFTTQADLNAYLLTNNTSLPQLSTLTGESATAAQNEIQLNWTDTNS
jgi:hypothetical protein